MLSISKISNSKGAAHYYSEKDDYYSREAGASSKWFGNLASRLNLKGEVIAEDFKKLLDGNLPDGSRIGKKRSHARMGSYT